MAIALVMEFSGVGSAEYDGALRELDLDNNPADGALLHLAGPSLDGSWRVVDVWESQAKFDTFYHDRLSSALQNNGFVNRPKIAVFELHNSLTAAGPLH